MIAKLKIQIAPSSTSNSLMKATIAEIDRGTVPSVGYVDGGLMANNPASVLMTAVSDYNTAVEAIVSLLALSFYDASLYRRPYRARRALIGWASFSRSAVDDSPTCRLPTLTSG